ncbi:MAG: hypothetical protein GY734_01305 [Herbaspirillum sp.]|nr:hypothetical protein [Herbaspirillum sp.]
MNYKKYEDYKNQVIETIVKNVGCSIADAIEITNENQYTLQIWHSVKNVTPEMASKKLAP